MKTHRKKSPARSALIILAVALILAAAFHYELVERVSQDLPNSRSGSAAGLHGLASNFGAVPDPADASAPELSADEPPRLAADRSPAVGHGPTPTATAPSAAPPDDDPMPPGRPSAKSDKPGVGASAVELVNSPEKVPSAAGDEPRPSTAESAPPPARTPAEEHRASEAAGGSKAVAARSAEAPPSPGNGNRAQPGGPSSERRRESEATAAMRVALALQDAGEVEEAEDRLRSVVAHYPGTAAARLAERMLQSAEKAVGQQAANLLQRAEQEQAAGRWTQARHFLELAATMYRGTAVADEARKRLKTVVEAQWKQLQEEAAGRLRQADTLQEQGELGRAQRLFEWITTSYRGTPAADEAAERLTALAQDAEGRRKQAGAESLRKAISLHESGDLTEAQRLLEWIVATYGDTPITAAASQRLKVLRKTEQTQRGQTAADVLREAVSLQEQGKLTEARRLLFQIVSLYRHTPQHDEALRLQRQVEQALAEQEAEGRVRRAVELQQQGQTDQARWLLEQVVRKYRHTPAAREAAARLDLLNRQQP